MKEALLKLAIQLILTYVGPKIVKIIHDVLVAVNASLDAEGGDLSGAVKKVIATGQIQGELKQAGLQIGGVALSMAVDATVQQLRDQGQLK